LYDLGYNTQQAREIIRLTDWMMHLRVDLEARFQRELNAFEEERNMPYVTSFERLAEVRGAANGYLNQLTAICGVIPKQSEEQVRELNIERLNQLGKDLLQFKSLADLEAWLERHAGSNP
jgi:hypothetical protein